MHCIKLLFYILKKLPALLVFVVKCERLSEPVVVISRYCKSLQSSIISILARIDLRGQTTVYVRHYGQRQVPDVTHFTNSRADLRRRSGTTCRQFSIPNVNILTCNANPLSPGSPCFVILTSQSHSCHLHDSALAFAII